MLVYKLLFNFLILSFAISPLSYSFEKESWPQIYSYKLKSNVPFKKILNKGARNILLIDEHCNVCESLLLKIRPQLDKSYILAVVNEPSFKWQSKLKRQGIDKEIYNIKTLNYDFNKGTPQLYRHNNEGKLIQQLYGKKKILKTFIDEFRK